MGRLLTIIESARMLGLSEQTMRNWIKDGHISVKEVGRARYIDEDIIKAMQATVEDIQKAENYVSVLRNSVHIEVEARQDERDHDRFMRFASGQALRSGFFHTVIHLLSVYGELSEREAKVLTMYLEGCTIDHIGKDFGVTRERIRQVVERAIRRSNNLMTLEEELDKAKTLRSENEALKNTVKQLTEKLKDYENQSKVDDSDVAELKRMCDIFSTRLVDCDLSIRLLNCLKAGRYDFVPSCETIGDVCKLSKTDFLKIRSFGRKSLTELDNFLESKNLSYDMDVDKVYADYSRIIANG